MKLIYGNSYCTLEYGVENIRNIVIKYRGNITIRHHHMEFLGKLNKHRGYFFNFGKKLLTFMKLLLNFVKFPEKHYFVPEI